MGVTSRDPNRIDIRSPRASSVKSCHRVFHLVPSDLQLTFFNQLHGHLLQELFSDRHLYYRVTRQVLCQRLYSHCPLYAWSLCFPCIASALAWGVNLISVFPLRRADNSLSVRISIPPPASCSAEQLEAVGALEGPLAAAKVTHVTLQCQYLVSGVKNLPQRHMSPQVLSKWAIGQVYCHDYLI